MYVELGTAVKRALTVLLLMQCKNADVSAMTRVLVGVEMLRCNRNPRHMEFSVPSLSTVCALLCSRFQLAVTQMATADACMTHEPAEPVVVLSCVNIFKETLRRLNPPARSVYPLHFSDMQCAVHSSCGESLSSH